MVNYEVTFIVDPVLSGDEINATAQTYVDLLKNEGCNIVHVNELGLRPLAYAINKRQSGVYYCVEFEIEQGNFLSNMELSLRRDERIMRFLTVRLDKFGVKYNGDKRSGLIGKKKPEKKRDDNDRESSRDRNDRQDRNERDRNAPAPKKEANPPAPKNEAPIVAVPAPQVPAEKKEANPPAPKKEAPAVAASAPEVTAEKEEVTPPAPIKETPEVIAPETEVIAETDAAAEWVNPAFPLRRDKSRDKLC